MTGLLIIATIVLGYWLVDTRRRLHHLETRFDEWLFHNENQSWPTIPREEDAELDWEHSSAVGEDTRVDAAAQAQIARAPAPQADVWSAASTYDEEPALAPEPAEPYYGREETDGGAPHSGGFEDLFGRKLPIWAGGITLIVAVVLLVRYSIDAGLLSPAVRVVLGLLLSTGLISGAEVARRKTTWIEDERIAQALAGAGVGGLYAATLAASNLYALISPVTAFFGLGAITALAMALALRFGAPAAVLGLAGGLATPALINLGEPNVPLLSAYIALVVGGSSVLSRSQRWFALGMSALVGGGIWTAILIVTGGLNHLASLSVGGLVLILGLGLPVITATDKRGHRAQVAAAIAASFQLALLVATGGYTLLNWGLYGLLCAAFIGLTIRTARMRSAVLVPLFTSLILAASWPEPDGSAYIAVSLGITLLFGGSALWTLWRTKGTMLDAAQLAATALGGFAAAYSQFYTKFLSVDIRLATLALGVAALPAAGALICWKKRVPDDAGQTALLVLTSGILCSMAAILGFAPWTIPAAIALIAGAILMIGEKAQDVRITRGALAFLAGSLVALLITGENHTEWARFTTSSSPHLIAQALLRWGATFAITLVFCWRLAGNPGGRTLQCVAAILGYGLAAQCVPAPWLAIVAASLMVFVIHASAYSERVDMKAAPLIFAIIAVLWALDPLGRWMIAGTGSLVGVPVRVTTLPALPEALRLLLAPATIGMLGLLKLNTALPQRAAKWTWPLVGGAAFVGAHILYKQLFLITNGDQFVHFGLAERTLWEALLIAIGASIAHLAKDHKTLRHTGGALVATGIAHNLYYSLLLHNPLWADQAVGSWPVVNLLLPAFAIAFVGPSVLHSALPRQLDRLERPAASLRMAALLLFVLCTLRQFFGGTLLAGVSMGANENILWSVAGIGLGLGYLLWGIRSGQRMWRIGSLVFTLATVAKVFLLDASGLEGLLRIASFLALGFSLIGIGWLYSRYLNPDGA